MAKKTLLFAFLFLSLVPTSSAGEVERIRIRVGELTFDARAAGPRDGELVLLLHGFPQTSHAFRHQMGPLASLGFRVVAPDQRGYSRDARPKEIEAYAMPHLVDDVTGIADALGYDAFHLVGHDWGGAVAWVTAIRYPARVRSLTVLSTPHPGAFGRALSTPDSEQSKRSSYFSSFAETGSEKKLLADDARLLKEMLASPAINADDRRIYLETLGDEGALRAALNWYRALVSARSGSSGTATKKAGTGTPRAFRVPTLYIWGEKDQAFGRGTAEGSAEFVHGYYEFHALPDIGHWIAEDAPELTSDLIVRHLDRFSQSAPEPQSADVVGGNPALAKRGVSVNGDEPRTKLGLVEAATARGDASQVSTIRTAEDILSNGRLGGVSLTPEGVIYVANFGASLWRVDPDGTVAKVLSGLKGTSGNTVDTDGNVYQGSFLDNRIVRVRPDGTSEDWVTEGLDGPVGMVAHSDRSLFVCNCKDNSVVKVGADRVARLFARSPDFDCTNGIALDRDGSLIVVSFKNAHVVRVDGEGNARRFTTLPGGGNAHVAVTHAAFYVTKIGENKIYRVTRDGSFEHFAGSGVAELEDGPLLEAGLLRPNGIAASHDGHELVVNNLVGTWQGDEITTIVLRRIQTGDSSK